MENTSQQVFVSEKTLKLAAFVALKRFEMPEGKFSRIYSGMLQGNKLSPSIANCKDPEDQKILLSINEAAIRQMIFEAYYAKKEIETLSKDTTSQAGKMLVDNLFKVGRFFDSLAERLPNLQN